MWRSCMACSMLLEVMMALRASTGTHRLTVSDYLPADAEVADTWQTLGFIIMVKVISVSV